MDTLTYAPTLLLHAVRLAAGELREGDVVQVFLESAGTPEGDFLVSGVQVREEFEGGKLAAVQGGLSWQVEAAWLGLAAQNGGGWAGCSEHG